MLTPYSFLCNDHFPPDDYKSSRGRNAILLKEVTAPSVFWSPNQNKKPQMNSKPYQSNQRNQLTPDYEHYESRGAASQSTSALLQESSGQMSVLRLSRISYQIKVNNFTLKGINYT